MRSLKEIKYNYNFTSDDEQRLMSLKPVMEVHVEEIAGALSSYIMSTKIGARLLTPDARRAHLFEAQKNWFIAMFDGKYDNKYFERLIKIGIVHVKREIDAHYLNRAVNIIRTLGLDILYNQKDSEEEIIANILVFEKILDINLDVMTSSYIEEEIRNYSSMYRIKSALIDFSEKFLQSANLVLVIALIGLTLGAIGLFITDVQKLFTGDLENGIITSLGSLLIIWVMIELMNTEISHLKGGKFRISVFVSVALVAVIRETMIATLKHEQSEMMMYLIASILVIGFVYWLVIKGEEQQR
jgi:uncharacterized membrane protein (DUF373 family)